MSSPHAGGAPHVLILAKTPYEATPYDRWLEGSDLTPLVIADAAYADGYAHLPHVVAVENYDRSQLVELQALEWSEQFAVSAVFARAEVDLVRAARLRELCGIPGQDVASARAFTDKVVMKTCLTGGDVAMARFQPVEHAYDILGFVRDHGYPVVVKPRSESGSLGTEVIEDRDQLAAYLASPWRGPTLVEKFVEGPMFHVNGVIVDGEIVFIHPFRYVGDCLEFRSNRWSADVPLPDGDPLAAPLVEATRSVLAQLPCPAHMAFHAELWITPSGDIVFCEIASRTPGGIISQVIRHGFSVDLDRTWFRAECGLPVEERTRPPRPMGGVHLPPLVGVLEAWPSDDPPECVVEEVLRGAPGTEFNGGVKSGLFLAAYVVSGASEEEVIDNLSVVNDWFVDGCVWSLDGAPA